QTENSKGLKPQEEQVSCIEVSASQCRNEIRRDCAARHCANSVVQSNALAARHSDDALRYHWNLNGDTKLKQM
uniref:Uncharacterized protein n=1 Tax=Echinococcus canadensis TaxID=519352 RepID=A0A915EXC9_9CEST